MSLLFHVSQLKIDFSYLKPLLFEPRTDLLQLIRQVGQRCTHQLLLVLVPRPLANQRSVAGDPLHLIRNQTDFALQFLWAVANRVSTASIQKMCAVGRTCRNSLSVCGSRFRSWTRPSAWHIQVWTCSTSRWYS